MDLIADGARAGDAAGHMLPHWQSRSTQAAGRGHERAELQSCGRTLEGQTLTDRGGYTSTRRAEKCGKEETAGAVPRMPNHIRESLILIVSSEILDRSRDCIANDKDAVTVNW